MARRISSVELKEYEELHAFAVLWHREVVSRACPQLAGSFKSPALGGEVSALMLEGLRQTIYDIIEETSDWPIESVKKVDVALASEGYVTLSALRRRYKSKYTAILKRGKIKSDTEFYLISGIAGDMSLELTVEERRTLDHLLLEYEKNV